MCGSLQEDTLEFGKLETRIIAFQSRCLKTEWTLASHNIGRVNGVKIRVTGGHEARLLEGIIDVCSMYYVQYQTYRQ
jgi:hypothetical protein